jgi:hypothetical protein
LFGNLAYEPLMGFLWALMALIPLIRAFKKVSNFLMLRIISDFVWYLDKLNPAVTGN